MRSRALIFLLLAAALFIQGCAGGVMSPLPPLTPPSGNPLSNSGANTVITVAGSSLGQVSYDPGSANPGGFGTWYVYADDPGSQGGAVTYQATSSLSNVTGISGRKCFGKITTMVGNGTSGESCDGTAVSMATTGH